jgi:replicative DNA helicase
MKNNSLPYDLDSEESVLGSLLIDSDAMYSIDQWIDATDFFSEQNQLVFQVCKQLSDRGEAIDQITVARELVDIKKLNDIGGAGYLSHLVSIIPTSLHIEHYARIVKRLSTRRRIISAANQMETEGYNEPDVNKSMESISKMVLDLQKTVAVPQLLTPNDIANLATVHYADAAKGKRVSISCGVDQIDELCGGMFPGEYWILGAATGLGKTSFVVNTIANRLIGYFKVLYVGLEMTPIQIVDREIASATSQPLAVIRRGRFSDDLSKKISVAIAELAQKNLYFYSFGTSVNPQSITTDSIFSVASYMKMAYGLDLVIIDYLSLLDDNFGNSSYERVGYISRRLKLSASALGVPFLVVCQLNRELFTRQNREPQLSDLRDSGKLEQDADVVMFLHRDSFFTGNKDDANARLIVRKIRQGDEQNIDVDFMWDNERKRYIEY